MRRFITYIISLLSLHIAHSQTGEFFSPDKELSNSLINQIYQDRQGLIWIATESGLNKFDGAKYTIYKHDRGNPLSIKDDYVRAVFEDRNGGFWVGCINGLMKYDRATDSFENIEIYRNGILVTPFVACITELKNGDIWIATSGNGVFSIKKRGGVHIVEEQLSNGLVSNYLNLILQDSNGRVWIGSESNGLNCFDPTHNTLHSFSAPKEINSNNISSIAEDNRGDIFVGTLAAGLNKYNKTTGLFDAVPYMGNAPLLIKSLFIDSDNTLYIGTDGQGVKIYNDKRGVVEDYHINAAPFDCSKEKIHSVLRDRANNLWLGIFQKGVILIPAGEEKFLYYGFKSLENNPIGLGSVMFIYGDSNNTLWVGTDNNGIYGIGTDGVRKVHYSQTSSPNSISNIILSIFEDSDKNLWVGSYTKGLAKFDAATGICRYVPQLINEKIYSIKEDNNKNLLIGTYGSGLFKMNIRSGELFHYESRKSETNDFSIDELSNDWINDILFDSQGLIWIAHFKGVSCFDPQKNTFINYLDTNTIMPLTVANILRESRDGKIWIGSSKGVGVFDKKEHSLHIYSTEDGLPSNVVCGIEEDEERNIWVSTFFGISKFIPKEERFINYYAGDGLQGNEFTRRASFKDSRGTIYFGGIYGITGFLPIEIDEPKQSLNLLITNFYLLNRPIKLGDTSGGRQIIAAPVSDAEIFTLNYKDNTFTIEFSALEFANPERVVYQYAIDQINKQWTDSHPGITGVTYTDLRPGTYTFRLRAKLRDNYSQTKVITIVITPPWYLSVWAYIVYTMLGILLIVLTAIYIRRRVKARQKEMEHLHQEQINEARLQFFINISHEIRTPMTLIINPLEKLLLEENSDRHQKTYLTIYRNAQRILRLINQLMDIRKLDKGQMRLHFRQTDIVGFIDDLMLTFEYLAQRKNINFEFVHKEEKLNVWIDLNNFDKVLLNILSNAFKYTPDGGNITVKLTEGSDKSIKGPLRRYFEISVSDDGIGIDKDKLQQIFERFYQVGNDSTNFGTGIGLHLARSLVELHHGVIFAQQIEDSQGTRLVVRLPLGCDHLTAPELDNAEYNRHDKGLLPAMTTIPSHILHSEQEENQGKMGKAKKPYKILVVDDEDDIRQYIREELSDQYRIITCENGKKALQAALTEMPDLIISDVMMPEMGGMELVQKVKQNININHIPIMLLTAKATPENRIDGLDVGADGYISKPFNTQVLKSSIANLIENRERLRNKFSGREQPEDKIEKIDIKSSDEILMQRIMKIINENLSDPEFSVDMLAKSVGLSRVHIYRKLKELTNQSGQEFIKGIRLRQAADLLVHKKLTVSEVAYATGFSNLSHFSGTFKAFYGVSPKEYAAKLKIES